MRLTLDYKYFHLMFRDVTRDSFDSFKFSKVYLCLSQIWFFLESHFFPFLLFLKKYRLCSKFICYMWRRWAQQARSKDFGERGDRIRKVEEKRWTDKGWTAKRNELLPCRRRSVTDSSVFISFWHDSLVSSSLIVSFDSY